MDQIEITSVTREVYEAKKNEWRKEVFCASATGESIDERMLRMFRERNYRIIPLLGNFSADGSMPTAAQAWHYLYDDIPEDLRYEMFLDVYTMIHSNGDSRYFDWSIHDMYEYRPHDYLRDIPPEFAGERTLTVYRGTTTTETSEDSVHSEFSWSLSKDVALRFCAMIAKHGEIPHLYKAKIDVEDIIAYTNEREEFEIIQYDSVYDVRELSITELI